MSAKQTTKAQNKLADMVVLPATDAVIDEREEFQITDNQPPLTRLQQKPESILLQSVHSP